MNRFITKSETNQNNPKHIKFVHQSELLHLTCPMFMATCSTDQKTLGNTAGLAPLELQGTMSPSTLWMEYLQPNTKGTNWIKLIMVPSFYRPPSERTMAPKTHALLYHIIPLYSSHRCISSIFIWIVSLVALTPSSARRRKTSLESGERSSSSNRLPSWPRLGWLWQEYPGRALGLDTKKAKKKEVKNGQ